MTYNRLISIRCAHVWQTQLALIALARKEYHERERKEIIFDNLSLDHDAVTALLNDIDGIGTEVTAILLTSSSSSLRRTVFPFLDLDRLKFHFILSQNIHKALVRTWKVYKNMTAHDHSSRRLVFFYRRRRRRHRGCKEEILKLVYACAHSSYHRIELTIHT